MREALWGGLMASGGGWVIDMDIERFFDTVDRDHLQSFLDLRVRDGVVRRAIGLPPSDSIGGKWMNAGVREGGEVSYPAAGGRRKAGSCLRC